MEFRAPIGGMLRKSLQPPAYTSHPQSDYTLTSSSCYSPETPFQARLIRRYTSLLVCSQEEMELGPHASSSRRVPQSLYFPPLPSDSAFPRLDMLLSDPFLIFESRDKRSAYFCHRPTHSEAIISCPIDTPKI